jgi:hypothetical protein
VKCLIRLWFERARPSAVPKILSFLYQRGWKPRPFKRDRLSPTT